MKSLQKTNTYFSSGWFARGFAGMWSYRNPGLTELPISILILKKSVENLRFVCTEIAQFKYERHWQLCKHCNEAGWLRAGLCRITEPVWYEWLNEIPPGRTGFLSPFRLKAVQVFGWMKADKSTMHILRVHLTESHDEAKQWWTWRCPARPLDPSAAKTPRHTETQQFQSWPKEP